MKKSRLVMLRCIKKYSFFSSSSLVRTTPRFLTEEDEHFNWLKTTVYTVIGCTVAAVIIISFVVIIVFRLKMKRLRARRLAHQMERHRLRHQGEEILQLP